MLGHKENFRKFHKEKNIILNGVMLEIINEVEKLKRLVSLEINNTFH